MNGEVKVKEMDMTVEVVEYKTDKVVKSMVVSSKRKAEKVMDGLDINLDHDKYYTRLK